MLSCYLGNVLLITPIQSTQSNPPLGNPLKDEGAEILAQVNNN